MPDLICNAIASAYIDSQIPSQNFQGNPLKVYQYINETTSTYNSKTAYVEFDRSGISILNGRKIDSISIKYYGSNKVLSGGYYEPKIQFSVMDKNFPDINVVNYDSFDRQFYDIGESFSSVLNNSYNESVNIYGYYLPTSAQKLFYKSVIGIRAQTGLSGSTATLAVDIQNHASANPPTLKITYSDVPLIPTAMLPGTGAFVYRKSKAVFSWQGYVSEAYKKDMYSDPTIATTKFRYRQVGTTPYTQIVVNGSSYEMPANTLGIGNYEWQVVITSSRGLEGSASAWQQFTTIESTQPVGTPTYPVNVFINGDEANTFSWSHSISTGTPSGGSDLEYRYVGSPSWTSLASVGAGVLQYIVPANTFTSTGNAEWRVRTKNSEGVAGAWSNPAEFYVRTSIKPPTIASVENNKARPTITWNASGQYGFEVEVVGEYQSGVVAGTQKSFKIPVYLNDGQKTLRIRVYDNNGEASNWTIYSFVLSTIKPTKPNYEVVETENRVVIRILDTTTQLFYIIKNGRLVSKLLPPDLDFVDYELNGTAKYIIRAISDTDNFMDSDEITVNPKVTFSYFYQNGEIAKFRWRRASTGTIGRSVFNAPIVNKRFPINQYNGYDDGSFTLGFKFFKSDVENWQEYLDAVDILTKSNRLYFVCDLGYGSDVVVTGWTINENKNFVDIDISMNIANKTEEIEYE